MKRFLSILTLILAFTISVNAQVAPAKFFDNTSLELKGGINTPLVDPFKGISEQVGIQIEKGITPWLSFAVDGDAFIHQPYGTHFSTAFDGVDVDGLVKFNLFNLFGNYPGYRRVFEWNVFTGLGWSHRTQGSLYEHSNYGNYVAGTDFQFNLGKSRAWALVFTPEVKWAMPQAGKLDVNKAMLELNVGVVYHFKNKDGNRYFTKVKPYDQEEVDALNNRATQYYEAAKLLSAENKELKEMLENVPAPVTNTIVETVKEPVYILPPLQFLQNSTTVSETSYAAINEIANVIKSNPDKKYAVIGYASEEGLADYNKKLSLERAEAVVNALTNYGVNADQLVVKGDGATSHFSADNWSLNRVVIVEAE